MARSFWGRREKAAPTASPPLSYGDIAGQNQPGPVRLGGAMTVDFVARPEPRLV